MTLFLWVMEKAIHTEVWVSLYRPDGAKAWAGTFLCYAEPLTTEPYSRLQRDEGDRLPRLTSPPTLQMR